MNEQLKDFLKKASEDESIKDELKALEGLSAEENAEQGVEEMVGDAHAATAGTAIDVKRRSEHMENEDSLKIERLEDDGLQDVSGGAGDYVSHYQCPKTGKQLSSYDPYFARDCTMCQYWKQVIPGIRAECRY